MTESFSKQDIIELFRGIAVIIDDEIENKSSEIYKIKTELNNISIPVVTYSNIPNENTMQSLARASFIILDWKMNAVSKIEEYEDPIHMGNEIENEIINFISQMHTKYFIPIFIFTNESPDIVIRSLKDQGLYNNDGSNRIFVESKSNLKSSDDIISRIKTWLVDMPSVYVLKHWKNKIFETKNKMFIDMYECDPSWVKIVWDDHKRDTRDYTQSFGDFITRNLISRLNNFEFNLDFMSPASEKTIMSKKIKEGEMYMTYEKPAERKQAYVGDLFKIEENDKNDKPENVYQLNIRAQCSISRCDKDDQKYNPQLYCLKGKILNTESIQFKETRVEKEAIVINKDIRIDSKGIYFQNGLINLDIGPDRNKIDTSLKKNTTILHKGSFLEKVTEAIIAFVDDGKIIKFNVDNINVCSFESLKDKTIGRILPPHITRIQNKCAQTIIREGVMPTSEHLFE